MFKTYNCEACKGNSDYTDYKKARVSYQLLQSLFDMTDEELDDLLKETNEEIANVGATRQDIMKLLGATENNKKADYYAKSLMVYPEMCADSYSKASVKDVKASLVNAAKYGKLLIDGTYTFILPDVYAFMEWLFLREEHPKGLLEDGEISCKFFEDNEELDMLRSPHLNFAHCIEKNVRNEKTKKWFKSNGCYTSSHSLYSLEVMCDWDGDIVLLTRDKTMIKVAKRIREENQIVPLYYELKKASDTFISKETLYQGMIDAYSNGNIGTVSNDITKIWNNGNIGSDELKAISYLTLWNNVVIDSAKTLWFPDKSQEMEQFLKNYTRNKLPHFFVHINDKDKTEDQVEPRNDSLINRIESKIHQKKTLTPKNCGTFNYKKLMSTNNFRMSKQLKDRIIKKFKYYNFIESKSKEKNGETNVVQLNYVREKMSLVWEDEKDVVDALVEHYYRETKSPNKRLLWKVYGDVIYGNLLKNVDTSEKLCDRCGKRFKPARNVQKFCGHCAEISKKESKATWYKRQK